MTERKPQTLEDLDHRLREAQAHRPGAAPAAGAPDKGMGAALGLGLRLGVELVSALIVGVAIGYFLDRWLGTKPWLLILFFVLGSIAGLFNVFRVMSGQGGAVGYRGQAGSAPSVIEDDE